MIDLLLDPNAWAALVALSALEIVLGIDNVIFISVMVARLPAAQAKRARQIGLALAFVFRIILLFTLTWMMRLTSPIVTILGMEISGRDMILIGGGLFLVAKAVHEMHAEIEARDDQTAGEDEAAPGKAFMWVVSQLALVDLVFSLDSIITAIGMAQQIEIMVAAVVIAMIVMYAASGPVSRFVADHPTTKMLALAFLVLIGVALVADGFDFHIPRAYIYFSMAFAAAVEVVNVIAGRNRRKRRTLRSRGRTGEEA
ncbi:MAG: TerC family protein [Xanthobacteraceae bacterium]|nr:TerC family protein [Xanthobacteraceae bacterium]